MAIVVVLSAVLIAYSSTVHLVPWFNALYVPINLVAGALLAMVAWRRGLSRADVGLDPRNTRSGLIGGGLTAAVAVVTLAIGAGIPGLRPLFEDARLADIGPGLIAYRSLVRIPLGTALFEEFAFRGVLHGFWERSAGKWNAAVGTSVVFGLWHIRPTMDLLNANGVADGDTARILAISFAVLGTAVAGLFFAVLRIRTGSLWAPFIAHASINSMAIVTAALVNGSI